MSLTSPLRRGDDVRERSLGLLPAAGLEAAVGVDEEEVAGNGLEHLSDAVLDLLLRRDTGRVDIVHAGTDLVRVAKLVERLEQLHVALRRLDGDDVGVEALNGVEDVVEVGVAEVGVRLGLVANACGCELEGVDRPLEVGVPVDTTERKLRTFNEN